MCIASEHLQSLKDVFEKIKADFESLRKSQSDCDKELSAKYHEIESTSFNVVLGYKLAKDVQSILQKRRVIKGEFARLHSVICSLKNLDFESRLVEVETKLSEVIKKDEELRASLSTQRNEGVDE